MWTHKCTVYRWPQPRPVDPRSDVNVVKTDDNIACYWCGITEEAAKQFNNENKQFLQEINEHGQ